MRPSADTSPPAPAAAAGSMSGRNSAPPLPPEISEAAANRDSAQRSESRFSGGRGAELPVQLQPDAPDATPRPPPPLRTRGGSQGRWREEVLEASREGEGARRGRGMRGFQFRIAGGGGGGNLQIAGVFFTGACR